MQDLTDPAMAVIPQSVPDSGTPLRALVTGSGLYAASGVGGGTHGMLTALGLDAAGWALYSRPAQAAINAAYRAATPQAALRSLSNLQRLAAQDPALVPVYRRLVEQSFDLLRPVERPQSTRQPQPEATTP